MFLKKIWFMLKIVLILHFYYQDNSFQGYKFFGQCIGWQARELNFWIIKPTAAAFGYFLVSYLNQYVTAATHFSFFWTIWWVNRLLYPSTRVIYYLYCSYRQRPLTVQLKMEYSIIPLVHLSLELQPLLQLASSDVNLTCGVINKFSIRSFNSWVPLGLGLWLKWGRPAGTRMIIQSLQRCFH